MPSSSQCSCSTVSVGTAAASGQMKRSCSSRFISNPESVALPAQNLDAVAPLVAEHEERLLERVHAEHLLDRDGQTVQADAEVDGLAV